MDSRIVCLCLLVLFVDTLRSQPVNNTTTGEECLTNDACISGKICIARKCKDPCDKVCGLNTICVVHEGATLCFCKPNYEGDPFTECKPENAECTDDSMCTTDKSCIGHKCVDPCLDYCGINTVCRVVNHQPVCACLKGFFYTQDKGCSPKRIPECQTNSYCPEDRSCRLQKCVDPCQVGVCGNNTECHVKNHYPVCSCKVGFIGDAYNECVPYGSIENKAIIQKPIQEKKTFILVEEKCLTELPYNWDDRGGCRAPGERQLTGQEQSGNVTSPTSSKETWLNALKECHDRGMKLAAIENDDDWNYLVDTTRGKKAPIVWIGGHDLGRHPNFVWISSGQPVSSNRWISDGPDEKDSHNCLTGSPIGFDNFDCNMDFPFACEKKLMIIEYLNLNYRHTV